DRERAQELARAVLADKTSGRTAQMTAKKILGEAQAAAATAKNVDKLTGILLVAPRAEQRSEAAKALAETGAPAAKAALRLSFAGDVSAEVRGEALKALAKMLDPEIVQTAIDLLAARHEDPAAAGAALAALAECGDVRALPELLAAQNDRFK